MVTLWIPQERMPALEMTHVKTPDGRVSFSDLFEGPVEEQNGLFQAMIGDPAYLGKLYTNYILAQVYQLKIPTAYSALVNPGQQLTHYRSGLVLSTSPELDPRRTTTMPRLSVGLPAAESVDEFVDAAHRMYKKVLEEVKGATERDRSVIFYKKLSLDMATA